MSGDTGQLQKLTEQMVSARLAAYNPGGSLNRDVQLLRENAADVIAEAVLAQFGPERAERYAAIYAGGVDAAVLSEIARL